MRPPHAIAKLWHPPIDHKGSPTVSHRTSPAFTDAPLEFGRFRVLRHERQLLTGGVPVALGARAFDLLVALIEAEGALVPNDELQRRVWPGIFVVQGNLRVQISALRKALGEYRELIRSEHGRGYRFTGAVRWAIAARGWRSATDLSTSQNRRILASDIELSVIASRLTRVEIRLNEVLNLKRTQRDNGRRQRPRHCAGHSSRGTRRHRPINSTSRGIALLEKSSDLTC